MKPIRTASQNHENIAIKITVSAAIKGQGKKILPKNKKAKEIILKIALNFFFIKIILYLVFKRETDFRY